MSKKTFIWDFFLLLVAPVLGLYLAVQNKSKNLLVFAITMFFGVAGSSFIYIKGMDGHSHMEAA